MSRGGRNKKLEQVWAWCIDEQRIEYCKACKKAGKADCNNCEWKQPELRPENQEAWELWQAVQTQWRSGPSGPIGLDYGVMMKVARLLGVDLSPAVFGKIQALEKQTLDHWVKSHDQGHHQGIKNSRPKPQGQGGQGQ
ncbi:MAG: DUF1799 domain-containing protein [Deltaproteobacteria bacterium]|nr:DUF1799 domain-containing protein [Deltaproteobacteria bacterium]MBW2124223.1 DUF1799 domain-containing protein [Deltaproteobacteria bacterium]